MVTSGSHGRWFRDWPYRFGAFFASDYLEWLNRTARRVVLPFPSWAWLVGHPDLRTLDVDTGRPLAAWQAALDHSTYDGYWHSLDISGYEQMDIPVLHLTGWFDACAAGEYHHFHQMRKLSPAADKQSLVAGPWITMPPSSPVRLWRVTWRSAPRAPLTCAWSGSAGSPGG